MLKHNHKPLGFFLVNFDTCITGVWLGWLLDSIGCELSFRNQCFTFCMSRMTVAPSRIWSEKKSNSWHSWVFANVGENKVDMNMARIDSVCVINLWNFRWIIAYFPIAFKDCEVLDQFQWLWNRTFSERVNWAFTLTEAPVAIWKKVWLQRWWWRGGWRWWQWGEDDKTGVHLGDGMLWYFDDLANKGF